MLSDDKALYANHRRFLEAQRGTLTRHAGFDLVHGDIQVFQIAMLHDIEAASDARGAAANVFAPPWADPGVEAFAGLSHQLTHMSLARGVLSAPAERADLSVEIVRDEAGLRGFTEVQAAGFAQDDASYAGLYDWMWDKNQRAFALEDQRFYCLYCKGEAASVLLTVDSDDALGIYAVATPRGLRKRGLSSYLLASVCANAPSTRQICLQVMRGSDAERLYAKLGFVERFIVNVYATEIA
jgi:GNAT superfamily N-acetyltransferase